MVPRQGGPARSQARNPAGVGRRWEGDLDVVLSARELDTPQDGGTAAADDRLRQEDGRRRSAELVSHLDAGMDVDIPEKATPRRPVELSARQQSGPHRLRPAEDVNAQLSRNAGWPHPGTVPEWRSLSLRLSTGLTTVRVCTSTGPNDVDICTFTGRTAPGPRGSGGLVGEDGVVDGAPRQSGADDDR